ncbi:spiroplasma phage ORF1-like family protein [Spiroplasma sp. hyd1]|nr:DUF3688 family protein [Spiroplasma sp. hyd1]
MFKLLDYFYSNILRTLFDVSNYKEYLIFTSLTGNLGFSFFVKNGFLLYPKSMLFNFWVSNGTDPQYQVKLANAFKINSNDNYYSYLSNWDYLTDVLPGNGNGGYESKVKMLDMTTDTNKYRGFNIITFQSKNLPSKSTLNLFGFNFSIYNASDWNNEINGGDIWNLPYSSCTWYNVFCHIKNGFIWAFNNLPGIKEVGKYANALVNTMQNVNLLWDNISNFFAFDIAFKLLLGAIITLAMFNDILRFL